jgi:cytochrome P450 family 135
MRVRTPTELALPPGPSASSLRQLLRYAHSPLAFLEASARRYGDPFTIRLAGFGTLVIMACPTAIKDVFRGDPRHLHSGEGNEFLSLTVGRNSVLVLDEEPHARQRRVQLPPLKGERMRSLFSAMQSATTEEMHSWPHGETLRMVEPMQRVTLRVMLQAVLGLGPGPRRAEMETKVQQVLRRGRSRYGFVLAPVLPARHLRRMPLPFFRELNALDEALFELIRRERQSSTEDTPSVLADLIRSTHESGETISDQEVRDALVTLLFAGHDTTALAIAWALEQIVPCQEVATRIVEEINRHSAGTPPRADELDGLRYLDAVIRESLRRRTILPFVVRLTKRPFVAGGREYPAGVLLSPCNHLVHRREDLYPNPTQFRPERFLERRYAANEWFPFGGGPRMCLGMAFALYEMKVVLSTLFATCVLARPPGSKSRPVRSGISLAPDDGARMTVVRNSA